MDASRVEKKLGINSLNICDTTQKKGDLGLSQQNLNLFEWIMWPLTINIHMITQFQKVVSISTLMPLLYQ